VQQLAQFLKTLTGPAWLCFIVALAGFVSSLYAWLPLDTHPVQLSRYLFFAAMAAGLIAFMSMAGHHLITWEHRKAPQPKIQLPRAYWVVAAAALGYFLVVFFGIFIAYPTGVDLGASVDLRVASAAALLFGVYALGFTQWAGLRVRALQSAP
jgi:hypothetical protein